MTPSRVTTCTTPFEVTTTSYLATHFQGIFIVQSTISMPMLVMHANAKGA